ncbi:MAG TPA: ABC transporter permease [Aggregatilineales bacterium]|nr:ABC transporter permease [Aggregatilineales bacterium]
MTENRSWDWLRSWEALLTFILIITIIINVQLSSNYLTVNNLINLFHLSIEKIIVALIMALIIINGEIDLSVGSVMGLAACTFAWAWREGASVEISIVIALGVGTLVGMINAFWVAVVGLPSLAVTLAGLIGYRGLARVLLEDQSITGFPQWFNDLGQKDLIGPFPASLLIFAVLFIVFAVVLHLSGFGRHVYIIGNNKEAARFSGIHVRRVKMILLSVSSLMSALAGILYVARLGAVRGDAGTGFELDIITIVLLGGISIFGGRGTLIGVGLSILVVLNIRNGMSLAQLSGDIQTSVVGTLLILSVLIPNLAQEALRTWNQRQLSHEERMQKEEEVRQSI